jgi:hypothetical protein
MINAIPAHFTEVDQTVGSANIDESAKVSNAGNTPGADITFVQILEDLIADNFAGLGASGALAEDKALSLSIDFNDTDINGFADNL